MCEKIYKFSEVVKIVNGFLRINKLLKKPKIERRKLCPLLSYEKLFFYKISAFILILYCVKLYIIILIYNLYFKYLIFITTESTYLAALRTQTQAHNN